MSEEVKQEQPMEEVPETEENIADTAPEAEEAAAEAPEEQPDPAAEAQAALKAKEDQFLRLAAEYDNFRKRTQKEKTEAYTNAKVDAVLAFLPVYDNLKRALEAPCADEAYAKGVQMTMNQLKGVLEKLGVTEIEALGQTFDPNFHNAVMHIEDEAVGENTIVEVFETGFRMGEKVVRFAMVKVAN